jgi:DinB superfamily
MAKSEDRVLRDALVEFLRGASAHADFETVVKGFPAELRGKKPKGSEHSAWQLVEHIRLALDDLYAFSTNPEYTAMKWPDDYWPEEAAPPSEAAWSASVRAVKRGLEEFEKLIGDAKTNFSATIPWGEGQTILREVLLAGQHTSYHVGQLVSLRRELGAWKGK